MTQIASLPPLPQMAWYNPGSYLPDVQAQSPQAPDYPVLDKVELAVKSLYAGRVASRSVMNGLENRWEMDTNTLQNRALMGKGAMSAAGKSMLVAGGLSVLRNMASLAQGDVNVARATGNVSSDIATGAISGMVAGATGAMAANAFINSGAAISGTMGTLIGAVGFVAADYLLDKTGFKSFLSEQVTSALEGLDGQSALPVELSNQQ